MRVVTCQSARPARPFFCFAASALCAFGAISLPPKAQAEAAGQERPQGAALTGVALRAPEFPLGVKKELELDLKVAQAAFDAAPDREDSYIWLGRRLGYLGRYEEAVAVFSQGLEKFPDSYKLLRFRGRHKARSRDFDGAIADYKLGLAKMEGHADSFEPDGAPNARGLTIGTYRSNLHYYLGQTSFAVGDYRQMAEQLDLSLQSPIALPIEDHKVAVAFWKYIALMKLGEKEQARAALMRVPAELDLIENEFYHKAVLVLQGRASEADVETNGDSLARFALGMKKRFEGDDAAAKAILESVVRDNALGYWPAEVELVSMK